MTKRPKTDQTAGLSETRPHYFGHRERLRDRFRVACADAVNDYELLELVLFRAIPQRDVKPLAKDLISAPAGLRKPKALVKPPSPSSRSCTPRQAGWRAAR